MWGSRTHSTLLPQEENATPAKEREHSDETETAGAFAASVELPQGSSWLVNSGASSHMRSYLPTAWNLTSLSSLGNGHFFDAVGAGNVHLSMLFKVSQLKVNVMHGVL